MSGEQSVRDLAEQRRLLDAESAIWDELARGVTADSGGDGRPDSGV